jgi:hypothetical protein
MAKKKHCLPYNCLKKHAMVVFQGVICFSIANFWGRKTPEYFPFFCLENV